MKKPIIVIRKFKNQEAATRYLKSANNAGDEYLTKEMDYVIYPLTQGNYREVLRNKSFDGYQSFFEENYDF